MKYVKMLGLAAVAAMALMAFIGASSASATVLCKTTPTGTPATCPPEWDYGANTVIDGSLEEPAILETLSGTELDKCTNSTVKGKTTNTGSATETVDGPIEELTWVECSKTTETFGLGELEVHWIEGTHNGTLTGKNSKVLVNTIFGKCTYGTSATGTDLGTLTSGTMATIDINAVVPLIGDDTGFGACPKETRWTAKYTVTSPEPLYVAKET